MHDRLVGHSWQRAVLEAGVGEEVPVFGGQDCVAEDRRHFVVGDDAAVLPRQLDKHCALRVVDLAGRRNLETDEALEIGQAAPVEVDVVDEPDRRKQEQQRKERRHEPHALSPTHRLDDRKHFESLTLADSSRRHPPCLWDLGLRPTSAG